MQRQKVNPWSWQDAIGFSQAWRVDDGRALIFVSGQTGVDADGEPVHEGDFAAEARLAFENMATVLEQADSSLGDVVKLNVFLRDIRHNEAINEVKKEFLPHAPAQTTLAVSGLADPRIAVELEAYAVA